jgi:hypothetical protein
VTPTEPTRDLVLSVVQDYDWETVRPFVESLRATGYRGEIRFFVSSVNPESVRRFHEEGIETTRPPRLRLKVGGRVLQPYNPRTTRIRWHVQPLYRHIVRGLAGLARDRRSATARLAGALANLDVARHFWYWDYLSRNVSRYRNVMLSDARDVLFLGNPFDLELGDGIYFFQEDERLAIRDNVNNAGWLHGAYGQQALDELGGRPIVCAGVTIGAAAAVLEYERIMVDELSKLARQFHGMDQGVHNFVVHSALVPHAHVVPNREGPVLTMGLMAAEDAVPILRERAPELKVVHQYDRHPGALEVIRAHAPDPVRA